MGSGIDPTSSPLAARSHETVEFEFHVSPAASSSRPQTSVGTCGGDVERPPGCARARGLTIPALAKQAGVDAAELASWESGSKPLPAVHAQRLKRALGVELPRPYDLRHSFVSLLLPEGLSEVEIAAQAGHAATMTLDTYGRVIAELVGAEKRSAKAEIRAAREAPVSSAYPRPLAATSVSQP